MSDPHITRPKQAAPSAPDASSKPRKEIPVVSVPNDQDLMAAEMAALFDEDRVSHQHGSSEPEAD